MQPKEEEGPPQPPTPPKLPEIFQPSKFSVPSRVPRAPQSVLTVLTQNSLSSQNPSFKPTEGDLEDGSEPSNERYLTQKAAKPRRCFPCLKKNPNKALLSPVVASTVQGHEAVNRASWRASMNLERMTGLLRRHVLPDSSALEREAYWELQSQQYTPSHSIDFRSTVLLGQETDFTAEQIEEYEMYLKEEEEKTKEEKKDQDLVGPSDRRVMSVVLKMAWSGLLNTSKVVHFKYNKKAFILLFVLTAVLTLVTMQIINPAFGELFAVQTSLTCPTVSDDEDTNSKLNLIQEKVRNETGYYHIKSVAERSVLHTQQAQSLLYFGELVTLGYELFPDFPIGCTASSSILAQTIINSALRTCYKEECDLTHQSSSDGVPNSNNGDIEVGTCKVIEVGCPLLPGLSSINLPGDVIEEYTELRDLLAEGNLNYDESLGGVVSDAFDVFADGDAAGLPQRALNRIQFLQNRALQLSAFYNCYLLLILLLAPPLILSKPGFTNRFVLGFLMPSKVLVYCVALAGLLASEALREEEFILWVQRIMADSCQVDPAFSAGKAERIMYTCNELFAFREVIRANRFHLGDLQAAAEAYEYCYDDYWSSSYYFVNAEDRAMANPFPYAFPVGETYAGVRLDTNFVGSTFLEELGLNTSLSDEETPKLPEQFLNGFSFDGAIKYLDLEWAETPALNDFQQMCNVPQLVESTYITTDGSFEVLRLILLLVAQAMIAPCIIKVIWHIFAELSPMAHARGKAEFFFGTRDDAVAGNFLTIQQYFVLKQTARRLDQVSHRKGLVFYTLVLPICIVLVEGVVIAPASAADYGYFLGNN